MTKVKRALISVSDKSQLIPFCKFLKEMDVEIISTGGTSKLLKENDIDVIGISEVTNFPEMLDGRVKTLHPKIHGGLLGLRDNPEHVETMKKHDIKNIDLVIVNLYPFEKVLNEADSSYDEIIENIDIGGPSMVRSAAKNYRFVGIVTNPSQYNNIMKNLKDNNGELSLDLKKELALEAFLLTSKYDSIISSFLKFGKQEQSDFPSFYNLEANKIMDLRYGENPHQKASFYKLDKDITEPCIHLATQLQGKELSFNNILDFDGALSCVKEFNEPTCVVVKHTNPCGVAIGTSSLNSFEKAWASDPVSAFGSVIAFNSVVDEDTAKAITQYFVEGVVAPEFTTDAKEVFKTKKNIRIMILPSLARWCEVNKHEFECDRLDVKKVAGGILVQSRDLKMENIDNFEVVTEKKPSNDELNDLAFAWKVVKHVKSNAIVYVKNKSTIGIGAGQMSRVDSSKIGTQKAIQDLKGACMASDAFFPFRDSIDEANKAGIAAIVQPGGSIRDKETIKACDEHGISMVFTHTRHFRH